MPSCSMQNQNDGEFYMTLFLLFRINMILWKLIFIASFKEKQAKGKWNEDNFTHSYAVCHNHC